MSPESNSRGSGAFEDFLLCGQFRGKLNAREPAGQQPLAAAVTANAA
jgi:hypothetical protein